jgi:adenine-specific DNA-methyltransferase
LSAIDDLIAQVQEPRLLEQLKREWAEAQKAKKFGLVFDRHLPELVPIPKARPLRGDLVAKKDGSLTDLWRLVVVRRFGEPIFPALVPIDQVRNRSSESPSLTLIDQGRQLPRPATPTPKMGVQLSPGRGKCA